MKLNNNKGFALVFTLLFVTVILAVQGVFVFSVIQETRMATVEREQAKTFYAAQGGANAALEKLGILINTDLRNTIAAASPSGVITYAKGRVSAKDGIGWLVYGVRESNLPVLTQDGEQATYPGSGALGGTNYSYVIYLTEKIDPSAAGTDAWDFPYNYRIEATGTSGTTTSKVTLNGDFTVRVQRDNYAKYALFTNRQQMPDGTNVWFTDKTNFAGPLHTNDRYNFAFNPSGTFADTVVQSQSTARYYNNGSSVLLNANANGSIDVPNFETGFTRNASQIVLNSTSKETAMVTQVKGNTNYNNNGIYLPASGGNLTGGIYVKGNSTVAMSVDGQNRAVYTIVQGASRKAVTVDQTANQTIVTDLSTGSAQTYGGKPDGADGAGTLVYVDGDITSIAGTVQPDTEVTVASHHSMAITNNIKYTNYDAASGTPGQAGYVPPTAEAYNNLLGLVSWNGNVTITTAAPNNVQVHGTVMAENGIFSVDDYDNSGLGVRGTATVLGGAITDNYGAFGQFNGSTGAQVSGYGRNFVYDKRMIQGKAPPYFPSLDTFIAFTNDITDKIVWQEGRE